MRPLAVDLFCGPGEGIYRMFQAYLITHTGTRRQYVGITSRSLRQRWNEHLYDARTGRTGMFISRAIRKYGADGFTIKPVCWAKTWKDICAVESVLVRQYGCRAPHGFNVGSGGEGPFGLKRSPESVERSAAKHRGKPCHPNTLAAALASKGRKKPTGHGAKVAAARRGIPRSPETKAKLALYWAARRANGDFKTSEPYSHRAHLSNSESS